MKASYVAAIYARPPYRLRVLEPPQHEHVVISHPLLYALLRRALQGTVDCAENIISSHVPLAIQKTVDCAENTCL
jgi:hypothetical protein